MEEYDFAVEHRPGKRHGNADGMSRRPCPNRECNCRQEVLIHSPENEDAQTGYTTTQEVTPDHSQPSNLVISAEVRQTKPGFHNKGTHNDTSVKRVNYMPDAFGGPADHLYCAAVRQFSSRRKNREITQAGTTDNVSSTIDGNTIVPWSLDGLKIAQGKDEDIGAILKMMEESKEKPPWEMVSLKSSDVKTLWAMWPRLAIREGLLKRKFVSTDGTSERWQVIWPKDFRQEFLTVAHGGMTGGHLGRRRTAESVQSRAYWPTWSSDLDRFMKQCEPCARYHRGMIRHQGRLQTSLVGEPWERVSVDITGPHPRSTRQNQYILTLVDHFSKWAEAIPLRNHTAPTVARALMTHVFSRFGAPRQLLTDRGPEFESTLFTQLMEWMEVDKLRTTAYKPSTNGVVERFHRTLNSMLGKVVKDSQRDWDERLPLVLSAYRASPHTSTGFSPNRLFLNRELRMPLDLIMELPSEASSHGLSTDEYVARMRQDAEKSYAMAREHLRVAAERRKATYDIRVKEVAFTVGDWVWYWYPRRYQGKSPKWQKSYTGPYLITRIIQPVNYVLQKTARSKPFVVHVDKLKKCYGVTPVSWLTTPVTEDATATSPPTSMRSPPGATPGKETYALDTTALVDVPQGHLLSTNDKTDDSDECVEAVKGRPRRRNRNPPRVLSDYVCSF